MHTAMTKMIFIVVIAIVLMTFRMSRAMNLMTTFVTRFIYDASGICRRLESGEDDADKHKNQD